MKGEFELIRRISARFRAPEGVTGIGDDCAILPQRDGTETLVSTDMLVEGSHFLLSDVRPRELGWKSAAVNISDIAAMGGRPTATFLSLALPTEISGKGAGEKEHEGTGAGRSLEDWMDEFVEAPPLSSGLGHGVSPPGRHPWSQMQGNSSCHRP